MDGFNAFKAFVKTNSLLLSSTTVGILGTIALAKYAGPMGVVIGGLVTAAAGVAITVLRKK